MAALWLIHRDYTQSHLRNSNNVSGVLVLADDEPSARAKAQAAARTGETKVYAEWQAMQLAESGALPGGREVLFTSELFTDSRRHP